MVTHDKQARQLLNRLRTAAGHVRGVQRMVEADAYCIDLIAQTQAVQRALDKVNVLLLEEHLNSTVTDALRDAHQPERERVIAELLTLFREPRASSDELPVVSQADARTQQRLAWLGQIEAHIRQIEQMIESNTYHVETIAMIKQVQGMLDAFQSRVLSDHLNGCVTTAIRSQQPTERQRVVSELLQVFTTGGTL